MSYLTLKADVHVDQGQDNGGGGYDGGDYGGGDDGGGGDF